MSGIAVSVANDNDSVEIAWVAFKKIRDKSEIPIYTHKRKR